MICTDPHGYEEHEQAELLVAVLQGVAQALQAGGVPGQLEFFFFFICHKNKDKLSLKKRYIVHTRKGFIAGRSNWNLIPLKVLILLYRYEVYAKNINHNKNHAKAYKSEYLYFRNFFSV